ncbi:MAG: hypothetical protein H7A23_11055 [Leptospiraceae bacterium]|nr:hypothetical protein [Leptospiraceae bacterium]MCP5495082.1 hypothetical protein [Leptospiraceae bacterium]
MKKLFCLILLSVYLIGCGAASRMKETVSAPSEIGGMTSAHNGYRSSTGVPSLTWDNDLASFAQEWADTLANRGCDMQHRSNNKYGENLAWASGQHLSPQDVVDDWYNEIKDYDYASNSCSGVCGHYTQVVWRDSQRLGCGYASCGNSEIWVCNYDPPGNYSGQKPY